MNRYFAGIIAGLFPTIVLSELMLMKGAMGKMPELNVIKILTEMSQLRIGSSAVPLAGWMLWL